MSSDHTNPILAAIGQQAITEVLADRQGAA